jgi:hypothetical protein
MKIEAGGGADEKRPTTEADLRAVSSDSQGEQESSLTNDNENGERGNDVRLPEPSHKNPKDLRGRVFATEPGEPPWWHEAHTGVPVLAHGIPNKLAESFARCAGDAVVPQAIQPIARAIKSSLALGDGK